MRIKPTWYHVWYQGKKTKGMAVLRSSRQSIVQEIITQIELRLSMEVGEKVIITNIRKVVS